MEDSPTDSTGNHSTRDDDTPPSWDDVTPPSWDDVTPPSWDDDTPPSWDDDTPPSWDETITDAFASESSALKLLGIDTESLTLNTGADGTTADQTVARSWIDTAIKEAYASGNIVSVILHTLVLAQADIISNNNTSAKQWVKTAKTALSAISDHNILPLTEDIAQWLPNASTEQLSNSRSNAEILADYLSQNSSTKTKQIAIVLTARVNEVSGLLDLANSQLTAGAGNLLQAANEYIKAGYSKDAARCHRIAGTRLLSEKSATPLQAEKDDEQASQTMAMRHNFPAVEENERKARELFSQIATDFSALLASKSRNNEQKPRSTKASKDTATKTKRHDVDHKIDEYATNLDNAVGHVVDGDNAYRIKDYIGALDSFSHAHKLYIEIDSLDGQAETAAAIGRTHRALENWGEAHRWYTTAATLYEKIGNTRQQALSIQIAAYLAYNASDYTTALNLYDQAETLYKAIGDVDGQARSAAGKGDIYSSQKRSIRAKQFYLQAAGLYSQIGNTEQQARNIYCTGHTYYTENLLLSALRFVPQAYNLYTRIGNIGGQAQSAACLGDIHLDLKDWDQALHWYATAANLYKKTENTKYQALNTEKAKNAATKTSKHDTDLRFDEYICYINKAIDCTIAGHSAYKEGDYTTAIRLYDQAYKLYTEIDAADGQAQIAASIGHTHRALHNWDQALQWHTTAAKLHKETGDIDGHARSAAWVGELYGEQYNWDQALQWHTTAAKLYKKTENIEQQTLNITKAGVAAEKAGKLAKARKLYKQARKISE